MTRAELIGAHPHLTAVDKDHDNLTTAAKNIRTELKRAFPNTTFAVKTKRFSGGDDIRVSWTDGPTTAAVKEITGKYSAGSFDGMIDLYTYEGSDWTSAFGNAKYMFETRSYSDNAIGRAISEVGRKYAPVNDPAPSVEDWKSGKCWNKSPLSNTRGERHWSWEEVVGRELAATRFEPK